MTQPSKAPQGGVPRTTPSAPNDRAGFLRQYALCILGGAMYGAGVNLFIVPYQMYSATLTGIAQMLHVIIVEYLGIVIPESVNLFGIILAVINIPLLVMAWRSMGRDFLCKTLLTVLVQTLAMSLIPIPAIPPMDSTLSSCLVGGVITGAGAGLVLWAGGSGGGVDVMGVFASQRSHRFTVGKISIFIGVVVYLFCLFRYSFAIVAYSILYTAIYSFCIDKVHTQTTKTFAIIISSEESIYREVIAGLGRGATWWKGYGAYQDEPRYVYITAMSKYEVELLAPSIRRIDPQAFIIVTENPQLFGNYGNRLNAN